MNENKKRLPRATTCESGQTAIVKLVTTNRGLPFKVSIAPESLQVHNHWVDRTGSNFLHYHRSWFLLVSLLDVASDIQATKLRKTPNHFELTWKQGSH